MAVQVATTAFNSPSDPEGDREGDWVGDPEGDQRPITPFAVGDRVHLAGALRYLQTADPMPMLRPPDLISADEVGQVLELRPGGALAVRFRRGTFLLAAAELRRAQPPG